MANRTIILKCNQLTCCLSFWLPGEEKNALFAERIFVSLSKLFSVREQFVLCPCFGLGVRVLIAISSFLTEYLFGLGFDMELKCNTTARHSDKFQSEVYTFVLLQFTNTLRLTLLRLYRLICIYKLLYNMTSFCQGKL